MKKFALRLVLLLALFSISVTLSKVNIVKADETIYIRADGSVEGTDAIQRDGNVYTFTSDIFGSIVVERNDIVVDGAGYTLQGTGNETGISLKGRSMVTIRNIDFKAFSIGILLEESSDNIVSGNNILNNDRGIYVVSGDDPLFIRSQRNNISGNNIINNRLGIWFWIASNNIISGNNITANQRGIELGSTLYSSSKYNIISRNNITNNDVGIYFFGSSNKIIGNYIAENVCGITVSGHVPLAGSQNNSIYHNSFIINAKQVHDRHWVTPSSAISVNIWDDGEEGNYWDVYTGVDSNGDGIGDTPYVIDENNQDNYPLMSQWIPPTQQSEPFPTWVVATIAVIAIGGVALLVYFTKVKKTTEKAE